MAIYRNKRTISSIGNISVGKSYLGPQAATQVGDAITGVGNVLSKAVKDAQPNASGGRSVEYINTKGAIERFEITSVNQIENAVTDKKERALLIQAFQTRNFNLEEDIDANDIQLDFWVNYGNDFISRYFNAGQIGTEPFGENLRNFDVDVIYDKIRSESSDPRYEAIVNPEKIAKIDIAIKQKLASRYESFKTKHEAKVAKNYQAATWNSHSVGYVDRAQEAIENNGLEGLFDFNNTFEKERKLLADKFNLTYAPNKVASDNIQLVQFGIIEESSKENIGGVKYVNSWIGLLDGRVDSVKVGNKKFTREQLDNVGITSQSISELKSGLNQYVTARTAQFVGINYLSNGQGDTAYNDIQISGIEKVTEEIITELDTGESGLGGTQEQIKAAGLSIFSQIALESNYVGNNGSNYIVTAMKNDPNGVYTYDTLARLVNIENVNSTSINFGDNESSKKLQTLMSHYKIDPRLSLLPGESIQDKITKYLSNQQFGIDLSSIEISGESAGAGQPFTQNLESLFGGRALGVGNQKSFTDLLNDGISGLNRSETKEIAKRLNLNVSLFGNTRKEETGKFSQILSTRNPIFTDYIKGEIALMVGAQLNNNVSDANMAITYNDIKRYTTIAVDKFSKLFEYDPNSRNGFVLKERMPVTLDGKENILEKSGQEILNSIDNNIPNLTVDNLQLEYASEATVNIDGVDHPVRAFQVFIADESGVSREAYQIVDGVRKNILWYDKSDIGLSQEELIERMEANIAEGERQENKIRDILDVFSFSQEVL